MDPWTQIAPAGLAVGLALAGATGLRTFLPLFAVALAGWGSVLDLSPAMQILATGPAVLVLGALAVAEGISDKIVGLDHAVDAIGFSLKPIAAMGLMIAVMPTVDPWVAGLLGALAGGLAATILGVAKGRLRLLCTATTGGLGNVALSLLEDWAAVFAIGFALLAPVLGLGGLASIAAMLIGAETVGRRVRWRSFRPTASLV